MNEELKPYKNLSLQDIEGEEWRDIEGFEGYYMVSNMGRVKSLARTVPHVKYGYMTVKEKILKQTVVLSSAMCRVRLLNLEDNLDITAKINRLVAKAFLNVETEYVAHKNMDITDNKVSNLEIVEDYSDVNFFYKRKKNGHSNYKGVSVQFYKDKAYYYVTFKSKKHTKPRVECCNNELEAAHKYDHYIKKYNLKRKGNFI